MIKEKFKLLGTCDSDNESEVYRILTNFTEIYQHVKDLDKSDKCLVSEYINLNDQKHYALKIMNLQKNDVNDCFRESLILQHANKLHDDIVKYVSSFIIKRNNKSHYVLVMELVPGQCLFDYLDHNPNIDYDFIDHLIHWIFKLLIKLHKHRLIHRDIKLENIMYLPETNQFKLIDFGYSSIINSSRPYHDRLLGTPIAFSPEQARKFWSNKPKHTITREFLYKGEVWAVGILLYEVIYQAIPYDNNNVVDLMKEIIHHDIKYHDKIPKPYNDILKLLLDKNVETRPLIKPAYKTIKLLLNT